MELGLRARDIGVPTILRPDIRLRHLGATSHRAGARVAGARAARAAPARGAGRPRPSGAGHRRRQRGRHVRPARRRPAGRGPWRASWNGHGCARFAKRAGRARYRAAPHGPGCSRPPARRPCGRPGRWLHTRAPGAAHALLVAVLFYHFGFLAISLALLGSRSAGALALYVRPQLVRRAAAAQRCSPAGARCLAVLLARRRRSCSCGSTTPSTATSPPTSRSTLALACVLAALPFTGRRDRDSAGDPGLRALRRARVRVDLVGAGVGARGRGAADVDHRPGHAHWSRLGALAAAGRAPVRRRAARCSPAAARRPRHSRRCSSATTDLYHLDHGHRRARPSRDRWTPLTRVLGYPPPQGSRSRSSSTTASTRRWPVHRPGTPDPRRASTSAWSRSAIGYELRGPGRALVIGGGGGRDIYNALSSGQDGST